MNAFNSQLFKVSIILTKLFGPFDFELSRFHCNWFPVFYMRSIELWVEGTIQNTQTVELDSASTTFWGREFENWCRKFSESLQKRIKESY